MKNLCGSGFCLFVLNLLLKHAQYNKNNFNFLILFYVLRSHMSMHCIFPWRPEEGPRSSGTGVRDGCGPPSGFWESNPGPLEKQPVLATT